MATDAPEEQAPFYITDRFLLLTKAKIYTSQHQYMKALYILDLLEHYGRKFKRSYFLTEVLILRAIILARLDEPWEECLREGVNLLGGYHCVRIFADYGKPLLPLWQKPEWRQGVGAKKKFLEEVEEELGKMAKCYPLYLQVAHVSAPTLTTKELEILTLVAEGLNNGEIAQAISASLSTVKFHLTNINKKLEVDNRTMAVKVAKEMQLI